MPPAEPRTGSSALASIGIEDTLEALLAHHATGTRTIYLTTLALVVGCTLLLVTASADVTVRAPAMLRPTVERQTIRVRVDGVVARLIARRDDRVRTGDTILIVGSPTGGGNRLVSSGALRDQIVVIRDLRTILARDLTSNGDALLESPDRRSRTLAAFAEARIEWRQLSLDVHQAEESRNRLLALAGSGFAAPAELQGTEYALAHARESRALAFERRRAEWTTLLAAAEQRVAELRRDLMAEASAHAAYAVLSPVDGTVDNLAPITVGTALRAGDPIATVSPDDDVVVDISVSPRDVGRIRTGMPVRLLVDGYDVQQWGTAAATVTSIAADYTLASDQPVFTVRASLVHPTLRQPNGRTAVLRKGLRCQARFLVGRQSLTALILHRANEWADPTVTPSPVVGGRGG